MTGINASVVGSYNQIFSVSCSQFYAVLFVSAAGWMLQKMMAKSNES